MKKLFLLLAFAALLSACSSSTPSNQIKYSINLPTMADLNEEAKARGVSEAEFYEAVKGITEDIKEVLTERAEQACKYQDIEIASHTFETKDDKLWGTITFKRDLLEIPYGLLKHIHANHIELPAGITSIPDGQFDGNDELESIIIPEGVKYIGRSAFEYCENLVSVKLPSTLQEIGEDAFSTCEKLTDITLPDGLIEIGEYAFEDCISLTDLKLPSSLREIGEEAFAGCESLTSIEIPKGITVIKGGAFLDCTNLAKVKLPSTVEKIEDEAFSDCTALKSINLNKVKEIDPSAFNGCDKLKLD